MPAFSASLRAAVLSPSSSSSSRARADERDAGRCAGARQRGILREKAIAGMDGVHALFRRQRDDAVDVQVGLDRAFALPDQVGFVGLEAVQAEAVFRE